MRDVAQVSRPFQIALLAVALLGLVWAVALRGHAPGSKESTGTAPAPAPAANAQAEAKAAAKATPIYHGAAPGVEGLTRAIAKAHGAVATSQRNAQELQQHSREASQEASSSSSGASPATHSSAGQSAAARVHKAAAEARHAAAVKRAAEAQHAAAVKRAAVKHPDVVKRAAPGRPAAQVALEHEVAQGKTVLLLFWDSKSSVSR
jgi:type IV secretory pathway VirB10-like protein